MRSILSRQFTQQVIQALEAPFPYLPVALEPLIGLRKWTSFQAAWPALSVASPGNQAGLLENSKVLRDCRLADREGLHQLGNRGLT